MGSRGVPGDAPGGPGELFGGPEATLRIRGATLEGPGGLFGASKNGPRVFFEILGGQIHIFPTF